MNIFDMEFDQLLQLLFEDPYYSRFTEMMDRCIAGSAELHQRIIKLNDLIIWFSKWEPEEKYCEFEFCVRSNPQDFDGFFLPDNADEIFPTVPFIYAEFYLLICYIEHIQSNEYQSDPKREFENSIEYLYRLLMLHEPMTLVDILERMDYYFNDCPNKDWDDLTPDQSLFRAQIVMDNPECIDDLVDLLSNVNSMKEYVQNEKEWILSQVFLNKEDFLKAIKHADRVKSRDRVCNVYIKAYSMLGDKNGLFHFFDEIGFEADELTLPYPLLILAWNMKRRGETSLSCKEIVDMIKNEVKNHVILYNAEDRQIITRDDHAYYLTAFDYLTSWLQDVQEYRWFEQEGYDLDEFDNPYEMSDVFRLCDDNLSFDIAQLISGELSHERILNVYLKYYEKLGDSFPEDNAAFLKFLYDLRLGDAVEAKVKDLLKNVVPDNDYSIADSMRNLLMTAYANIDVNDNEKEKEFKELFAKYHINMEDLDEEVYQKCIYDSLSGSGKIEYKAACIQYDLIVKSNYRNNDAGLLSMAFYRIIENESNKRIWRPLAESIDWEIADSKYEETCNELHGKQKKHFIREWSKNRDMLKKMNDPKYRGEELMLGPMEILQKSINAPNKFAVYIRGILEKMFTESGLKMFNDGIFEKWYRKENREKYRNPPAHNRYLHMKTAKRARVFVEEQLLNMKEMIRNTES